MGDYELEYEGEEIPINEPIVYSIERDGLFGTLSSGFSDADMKEYGIKIISYKFSDPIENSFE